MKKLIVSEENDGIRLDAYIADNMENLSRTAVKRLIEDGNIIVNNKIQKVSYKVHENDEIEINEPEAKEVSLEAQDIPVDVIYEDSDIIVVNKPKGLVVHPANGNWDGTLVNAIMAICKDSLSGIGGEIRPGIVHRLDKDTSGLLIVAKNDEAHINMSNQIIGTIIHESVTESESTIIGERHNKAYATGILQDLEVENRNLNIQIEQLIAKYEDKLMASKKFQIENNLI